MASPPIPEQSGGQIAQVLLAAERLLARDLLGAFLYGSATLGGLRPQSDIDLFLVVSKGLSSPVREAMTNQLLAISGIPGQPGKRPLEVTIVCRQDLTPWRFPPQCEYLYGEWLRTEIEARSIPQPHRDPDLTILLWQVREHSKPLSGIPASQLIPPIPFGEIHSAIRGSLPGLIASFPGDERNVLLTLARMWFTLEIGEICAKDAAADWVLPRLPKALASPLETARDAYLGRAADSWDAMAEDAGRLAAYLQEQLEAILNRPAPEACDDPHAV